MGLGAGDRARCHVNGRSLEVHVEPDDSVRKGVVTLPHGYGQIYRHGERVGPAVNLLTSTAHCDPLSKTPYHKYLPVQIEPVSQTAPFQLSKESQS